MNLNEFKTDIFEGIKQYPSHWRKGQKVFNYIDKKYRVARKVQFDDHIDCFYIDSNIDAFIEKSFEYVKEKSLGDDKG